MSRNGLNNTEQCKCQRTLPRSRAPHHANLFFGFDVQGYILEYGIKTFSVPGRVIFDRDLAMCWPSNIGSLLEDHIWSLAR